MPLLLPLDIVNAACARIGAEPLQSLDEETIGGQAAALLYEDIVDFNLGVYLFSWSRTIRQLGKLDAVTPLSGWTIAYQLPAERIGPPLWINDDVTDPDRRFSRYSLVGEQVHADCEPLFACIKYRPAPHLWSATFKTCTITALAGNLAMALASDRQTMELLKGEAYGSPQENGRGGQMRAAIGEDAFANPPRKADFSNNPLTRARWGS